MPQLQNNNIMPVKPNDANAPKNNSYINESKVVKDYRPQSNYTTILQGIDNIINNFSDKFKDFTLKTQQMEAENKFNEFQTKYNNRIKEYKFNYERNPSEDLTKEYEVDMQSLKDDYEKQIHGLYKNNFLQRVNLMDKSQNLDFFRKVADLQYQSNKYMESLNQSINIVNNASYEGNYDIINTAVAKLPDIKNQLSILYGDLEGNRLYNDYTKRLIKNYMGGRIASNNPDDVLDIAKVIEITPEFEDKLTAEEIEHYRQMAIAKKDKLEKVRKTQEVTEYAIKTNTIINNIVNQKLNNYEDIVNALLATGTDEYESKLIMKFAGYTTELPPELLNKNRNKNINQTNIDNRIINDRTINDKELNRKKSNSEKQEYKDDIQTKIFSLYEGIKLNNIEELKEVKDRSKIANKIDFIRTKLMEGIAGGYITEAEYSNYANQLLPYYTKVLDATAKGNFDDDGGWFHWSIGYDDLNKSINEILENNSLNTDNPEKLKGLEKEKYYFLKNNITSNYIKYMDKQFKEIKANDINGKYSNVNNWIEFQDNLDYSERKRMYNRALNYALEKYVRDDLNVDTSLYTNKNTDEIINTNSLLEAVKKKTEEMKFIDLIYKIE